MNDNLIVVYILLSILFMLIFALAVIWFFTKAQKKITESTIKEQEMLLNLQKELLLNTIKTKEIERNRISQELHDDVTSQLNIIYLNVHLLKDKISSEHGLYEIIDHIESSLRKSTERTRTISHELMPLIFRKFGIQSALKELEDSINLSRIFKLTIKDPYLIEITDEFKLIHIYRIIQELINNAVKYSKAEVVDLTFSKIGDNLHLDYQDNGVGFNSDLNSNGMGHSNINARVTLLDGSFNINSTIAIGTTIYFKFPNHD